MSVADWLSGRLAAGDDSRVIESALEWRTTWPSGVLIAAVALGVILAAALYRSGRLELPMRWRVTFGTLRAGIIAIPLIVLMQPSLAAKLEKQRPKTLAILLDQSASMTVRDGNEANPTTRWERGVSVLGAALNSVTSEARVVGFVFDDGARRLDRFSVESLDPPSASGSTAIGGAMAKASADLAGQSVAAVLLLTDGADNASTPGETPAGAARELARMQIPVHACLVGNDRPRDVTVSAVSDAPFAFVDDPVAIQVRVGQQGFAGDVVGLTVTQGDAVVASRDVILPDGGEPAVERFEIRPQRPGRLRIEVQSTTLPGELTAVNNGAATEIEVIDQPIRVLYVERWPRWQYRFLRNAMQRDPRFETRLVLLTEHPGTPEAERETSAFPATPEEMKTIDVIVIGDLAPQDLGVQQWEWVYDHVVNDGAGAVFIAGTEHMPAEFHDTPVGPLLPFERSILVQPEDVQPFEPTLTRLGAGHPIMELGLGGHAAEVLARLPRLTWHAGVADLKPGTMVLAEGPKSADGSAVPLVVLHTAGRGPGLFVGTDETWKWRYEVGNRFFYGFWAHAIQHVGLPHRVGQFRTVRIDASPRPVAAETPVPISVSFDAASLGIDPDAEDVTLVAQPESGGGVPISFKLPRAADSRFVFEGSIVLPQEGGYRLQVEGLEDQGAATLAVSAADAGRELAYPVVRPDVLMQVAELTGGRFVTLDQLPALVASLDLDPLHHRWSQHVPLWDGWGMLSLLALLLTIEWVLRKWWYLP